MDENKKHINFKKILISGGAGFIGSNLATKLREENPDALITVVDNLFTGKFENITENITFIHADTWDIADLFPEDEGQFDEVYHFGEYSRIVSSFKDIDYVLKTNLHGTTRVLDMCRKWGAKFIYSASSSKFGNDGKDENLSPYSWVKSKIVELIKNYGEWYDLQYEICYFFNVYGKGQITEGDYATVVGIFERQHKAGEKLTVVEPGTQTRDFTHIDDIVSGVIAASKVNKNSEWHLRSGTTYSIIDIAEMFESDWELIPARRGERQNAEDIPTDTQEVLLWKPVESIDEYIKDTINEEVSRVQ